MIDDIIIDSDEAGFSLELVGDFTDQIARYIASGDCRLVLRLPQDAAVQLAAEVRARVQPWVDEMDFERAAYERATPEERQRVLLRAVEPYDDDAERMREGADFSRKAAKERS